MGFCAFRPTPEQFILTARPGDSFTIGAPPDIHRDNWTEIWDGTTWHEYLTHSGMRELLAGYPRNHEQMLATIVRDDNYVRTFVGTRGVNW